MLNAAVEVHQCVKLVFKKRQHGSTSWYDLFGEDGDGKEVHIMTVFGRKSFPEIEIKEDEDAAEAA